MRFCDLQTQCGLQSVHTVGLFPGHAQVFPSHVTVGGQFLVDGFPQIQIPDDGSGAQVEHFADGLAQSIVRDRSSAAGIHHDTDRFCHANGISQLNQALVSQSGGHHIFGDIAGGIGCAAVHLGGVFAGECSAAMGGAAAVGVHNDLPTGQAGARR